MGTCPVCNLLSSEVADGEASFLAHVNECIDQTDQKTEPSTGQASHSRDRRVSALSAGHLIADEPQHDFSQAGNHSDAVKAPFAERLQIQPDGGSGPAKRPLTQPDCAAPSIELPPTKRQPAPEQHVRVDTPHRTTPHHATPRHSETQLAAGPRLPLFAIFREGQVRSNVPSNVASNGSMQHSVQEKKRVCFIRHGESRANTGLAPRRRARRCARLARAATQGSWLTSPATPTRGSQTGAERQP